MNYSYRLTLLSICVLLTAVLTAGVAMADIITYKANLTGVNAIPPNASAATGIAILTVDTDESSTGIPLYIEFLGLSSAQTAAHVHYGNTVIHPLPLGSPLNTSMDLEGIFEVAALAGESLSVNIHTVNYPDGEIRGNLMLFSTVDAEYTTWGNIKSLYR